LTCVDLFCTRNLINDIAKTRSSNNIIVSRLILDYVRLIWDYLHHRRSVLVFQWDRNTRTEPSHWAQVAKLLSSHWAQVAKSLNSGWQVIEIRLPSHWTQVALPILYKRSCRRSVLVFQWDRNTRTETYPYQYGTYCQFWAAMYVILVVELPLSSGCQVIELRLASYWDQVTKSLNSGCFAHIV
jgi:hypothetical protein